jgi:hypothetical protein
VGETAPDDGVQLREAVGCEIGRRDVPAVDGAASGPPAPAQPRARALSGEEHAHLLAWSSVNRSLSPPCGAMAMSHPPPSGELRGTAPDPHLVPDLPADRGQCRGVHRAPLGVCVVRTETGQRTLRSSSAVGGSACSPPGPSRAASIERCTRGEPVLMNGTNTGDHRSVPGQPRSVPGQPQPDVHRPRDPPGRCGVVGRVVVVVDRAPLCPLATHQPVISAEEQYLGRLFGVDYEIYRCQVRRRL